MEELEFTFNDGRGQEVRKGDLLLAEPFLADPNFARTVILVCEHEDDGGSFGLIVNKPTTITIEEATNQLVSDNKIFIGGPVEQNTLHFIHKFEGLSKAIPLKDGVYWGGDYSELLSLDLQGLSNPSNCRFFMGYSGWGKLQLKNEIEHNSWIVAGWDLNSIFDTDPDAVWPKILQQMGGKYKMFSHYPEDPRTN